MNPLAKLIGTAQTVARVPLHIAERVVGKAVKTVSGGAGPATEPRSTEPAPQRTEPAPPPVAEESIEELAKQAVAREMAEEPVDATPEPTPRPRPARKRVPEPDDSKPLIDSATAKAVRSESETLQAAADVDKKG